MIDNKSGPGGTGIPTRAWPQHREIGIGVLAYANDTPQATPTVQRITQLAVPGVTAPECICAHRGPRYTCNRPPGHTGRHSFRWYHLGGVVRGVWA